ncbi:MAG: matrixin family metalloprotease [Sandaracinaceae bacterium]|nr:matrixin family metalloprotease [Sandaracinaceae bacterium]
MSGWRSLAVVALLLGLPSGAWAWCRMTTSTEEPTTRMPCVLPGPEDHYLAWRQRCTVIAVGDIPETGDETIDAAARARVALVREVLPRSLATWEAIECGGQSLGFQARLLDDASTCTSALYRDGGGNANTVVLSQDWGYEAAAYAVTTVWHRKSTGEILDVDIEINERRGPYGTCPASGCAGGRIVDLENVLTHELGHYFGLAHSTEVESTMYASAPPGETTKRDLSPDDVAGLCAAYPAGSLPDTCDDTPQGGLRLDCNTGCSVRPARSSVPTILIAALLLLAVRRASGRGRRQSSSKASSRARRAVS